VETLLLDHNMPSYGFRITEKDKKGALDADRLKADGIPPGPLYGELKNGGTVTLADGRTISGRDYVGPPIKGRVIAILGDTRPCGSAVELAKNADMLVHESTFSAESGQMAWEYFHSTTIQAAQIAKEADARALCLTHISSRYTSEDWEKLEKEARSVFPNTTLASDFFKIQIPVQKPQS
jgi:ribonuclease Z